MELLIKGEVKEIADLVLAIQNQPKINIVNVITEFTNILEKKLKASNTVNPY